MGDMDPEQVIFCNQAGPQVFWNWSLAESSSKKPQVLHPATDGSRCRIPKSNIRQSLGGPVGELEEGSEEPEKTGTQEQVPENQLIGTHWGSQRSGSL